ncbi:MULTISPECIES: hypothetical protein [Pseudomonas]|jgi:hypothetical protein|uniref:Uncharacterized protein n=2 Tax=Pseudomonas TaxID=286 RepID=F2K9X0_PSEBN|nr:MULTISPECIES: hypothetical protein [Pseudomonas]AEA68261.1 Hypothetical protein PSEBR_cmegm52 [Pseudomonas brassicacearum subsp. brassicacearum NFM421]ALI05238.1 hypothetical protein AO356_00060 [Pseudomonas fluorescens]MBD9466351.1 hypothetical protein [Pseudomonas sp. Pdm06]MCS3514458.1 hypothetical protein [Pseudomonas grimontii]OPG72597.1 hypothetical protein B1219_10670 [Pseudomonas ogarae]
MLLENEIQCLKLGRELSTKLSKCRDDPLAMWLASYIRRLMCELLEAEDPSQLARASSACMDAILKLWEHRGLLPCANQRRPADGVTSQSFKAKSDK